MLGTLRRGMRAPVRRVLLPIREIIETEATSGFVLLAATVIALLWANSPWQESYTALRQLPLAVAVGGMELAKPLWVLVNDLLMAIFFFSVGLEIKRELIIGELRGWRRAMLPASAAAGGMLAPAAVFLLFNFGTETVVGWGVPMATDIAFALGVLALFGERLPQPLSVFLLATAIIDDIGAVLVIALFYSGDLDPGSLALAFAVWIVAYAYGAAGGGRAAIWATLGLVLWYFVLKSGIHATVSGVALAMAVPIAHWVDLEALRRELRAKIGGNFEEIEISIAQASEVLLAARSPLHRFEHALLPYVAYLIMPIFALLNAGVPLTGNLTAAMTSPLTLGIFLSLVLGKPLGIATASWLVVRSGLARLPEGIGFRHIWGAGLLAGIGFTMALFIANLAFDSEALLDQARLGILLASLASALGGGLVLLRASAAAVPAHG